MDDSDFATSHPIVRSLIENGEVTSTANGGGPGKQGTGAGGVGISRYGFTGFSNDQNLKGHFAEFTFSNKESFSQTTVAMRGMTKSTVLRGSLLVMQ